MRILLVVYDNESYIHWFHQGLAYIAAVLLKEGLEVEVYSQDKNHYSDERLTEYMDKNKFDIVGMGVIAGYYQYRKLLSVSRAINRSRNRPFYIIGGHGPSPEPEFFLKKTQADVAVIGEGEETIIELVRTLARRGSLANIRGIAFREGNKVTVNERRPLIKEIDSIPFPAYHLFPIDYYRLVRIPHVTMTDFVMPVLSARGCPFKCTFCYRMDSGSRLRSCESIIDEIKFLKERYGITYISFDDELLMQSVARTIEVCEALMKAGLKIKWYCNGRLNFARPAVLGMMKRAGCVFINYGIEAMDDAVLENMKKALTTKQIVKGIEATFEAGISPGFNMLFGNIGDTRRTLKKAVDFLIKYDDCAQMRTIKPVTPYPGSELYYYAIKKGLLKDCEDFYENKHVNSDLLSINFTDMNIDEAHKCLFEANKALIKNYFGKKAQSVIDQAKKLYLDKDTNFRGFRQT